MFRARHPDRAIKRTMMHHILVPLCIVIYATYFLFQPISSLARFPGEQFLTKQYTREILNLIKSTESKTTNYKTQSDIRKFKSFIRSDGDDREIEHIPDDELFFVLFL